MSQSSFLSRLRSQKHILLWRRKPGLQHFSRRRGVFIQLFQFGRFCLDLFDFYLLDRHIFLITALCLKEGLGFWSWLILRRSRVLFRKGLGWEGRKSGREVFLGLESFLGVFGVFKISFRSTQECGNDRLSILNFLKHALSFPLLFSSRRDQGRLVIPALRLLSPWNISSDSLEWSFEETVTVFEVDLRGSNRNSVLGKAWSLGFRAACLVRSGNRNSVTADDEIVLGGLESFLAYSSPGPLSFKLLEVFFTLTGPFMLFLLSCAFKRCRVLPWNVSSSLSLVKILSNQLSCFRDRVLHLLYVQVNLCLFHRSKGLAIQKLRLLRERTGSVKGLASGKLVFSQRAGRS